MLQYPIASDFGENTDLVFFLFITLVLDEAIPAI